MCGRYGLKLDIEEVVAAATALGDVDVTRIAPGDVGPWAPTSDIAPTDRAPIVRRRASARERQLTLGAWGIPRQAPGQKPSLVINARAETLTQRPLFRGGLPALIPATGWYEWPADQPGPGRPRPTWITQAQAGQATPTWLAGLSFGEEADGRFVIITRPPMPAIAGVHDRMPAVVEPALARAWLDGAIGPEALIAADIQRLHHESVEPRPTTRRRPAAPPGQLDLFGTRDG